MHRARRAVPRFGIIEASEPNAVTVGEGPSRGMIAVTRGLLERLDDDELAAVLAHEASHIRQGDTKLLAANHALMRTAIILQMNNVLRFESWRQMIIPLIIPPMMLVMLAGSAVTALSMQLARASRRGLKLGRDYVADGEAIRVTHFPEALISAIAKIGGRGASKAAIASRDAVRRARRPRGGSHPTSQDRIDAIGDLGGELINPARLRRDSRSPARPAFGRRPRMAATAYPRDAQAGRSSSRSRLRKTVAAVSHRPRDVPAVAKRLHRLDGVAIARAPQRPRAGDQTDDPARSDCRGRCCSSSGRRTETCPGWKRCSIRSGSSISPVR